MNILWSNRDGEIVFNTYYFTIETFKKQNKFVRNEAVDFDLKLYLP